MCYKGKSLFFIYIILSRFSKVAALFVLGSGCTAFHLPRSSAVGLFAASEQETLSFCGISLCLFVVMHFVFLW